MSFATDINTLLQSDTALNAALYDSDLGETKIYAAHLPDQFPIDKSALVFNYKKESGTHTLDAKNVLEDYALYIVLLAVTPEETETLEALVRAFVDTYSGGSLRDITYEDSSPGRDDALERYYKLLQYSIIYKP